MKNLTFSKVLLSVAALALLAVFGLAGCGGGGTSDGNVGPTAKAGNDVTVNKYSTVSLDATASSNATTYKWTQTEGPSVNLSDSTSATPSFTPKSAATYKFSLEARNSTSANSDEVIVVVQNISTVSITSPSTEDSVAVSQSLVDITGSAGQYIISVVATNKASSTKHTAQLVGDGTFSIQGVSLIEGDNELEVVGLDNTGAQTKDILIVTYNPSVNFLSAPSFSTDSAFVNESIDTVVSIAIEANQNVIPNGINLVAADNNGAPTANNIVTLYDNGNLANGDDIAGDGVYSAKTSISKPTAGKYNYRVAVNTGVVGYSSPVYFTVLTPLTDQEILAADTQTEAAFSNNFPAVGSKFTQSEFDVYKDAILAALLSLQDVKTAALSVDGNSIVVEYKSGLIHALDFVYEGTKGGGTRNTRSKAKVGPQGKIDYYPQPSGNLSTIYETASKALAFAASTGAPANNAIGSYRSLALSPFKWQFDPYDDIDGAYVEVQNSSSPVFTAETPIINYDVSVEHFKNLSKYGVIVISSHGGMEGSNPVIYTGEEATSEKQKTYQKDIDADRLLVSHKIEILVEDGGWFWFDSKENKKVFKIAPSFITQYNKNLPNTLVYMSICQGLSTDALANAFIAAGAGAFIGYTDVVDSSYALNAGKTFFQSMINGKTVKDAVKAATDAYGKDDGGATPAAFVYRGNGELVLERTGIQNGGFEENITYWEQNGGDVRVLSKLSSLSPQEGTYMSILSSGLGSVSDSEAIITQQFKIPAGVQSLAFNYDVVSEEPMEFVGSQYDDKFQAVLIDASGNEIELAYETVNTSTWIAITGSQSDGGMFDGGDGTAFHTGWKNVSYQISSLAGQTVTLKLRVWDVGDSAYDTAALIDSISLQ